MYILYLILKRENDLILLYYIFKLIDQRTNNNTKSKDETCVYDEDFGKSFLDIALNYYGNGQLAKEDVIIESISLIGAVSN